MDRATSVVTAIKPIEYALRDRKSQMGMKEARVWDRWMSVYGWRAERIGLNVPVWLDPPRCDESASDADRDRERRPDYRIDAIGVSEETALLIEVKETGNMTAVGQLMVYEMLFARTYYGYKEITKILVCKAAPEAISYACEKLGIVLMAMDGDRPDWPRPKSRGQT